MDPNPSKAERQPIPVATETDTVPVVSIIPTEIIDEIFDNLIADSGSGDHDDSLQRSLRAYSLVSKSWVPSCRRHLFHTITFTSRNVARWLETFPVPEESPAWYVKDLRLSFGGHRGPPGEFFKHIPWFTNAEKMSVMPFPSLGVSLYGKLPRSVTSLTIEEGEIDLVQMRDIMAHLPDLNDLILSGTIVVRCKKPLPGLGTVLKGRFGGELKIWEGYTGKELVDMLLEVPTGLHFTKLCVSGNPARLVQTVRLAEACCESLVSFSYSGFAQVGQEPFERSFDFSKFPRLQTVTLGLYWAKGPLQYIRVALPTLKPTTSPHLSHVHLHFTGPTYLIYYLTCGTSDLENLGNDLSRIADELSRIEREYEGAVGVSVFRSMEFGKLDKLNVLQRWDR